MNILTAIMLAFSMLGILDRIFGGRFGLGREFEKGFLLLGTMALTMIGMLVLAPALAIWMEPIFAAVNSIPGADASIIPALLFANDMGAATLGPTIGKDPAIAMFNSLVVSSMMGCTVSFSIPLAMQVIKKEKQRPFFFGTLCGIVTIPVGCFVAGWMRGLPLLALLLNMIPLFVFAALVAIGLAKIPNVCMRIFHVLGIAIQILITVGLAIGILKSLTKHEIFHIFGSLEEGGIICLNAAVTLSGAFVLMHIVTRLLRHPLRRLAYRLGISETSAAGFASSLVSLVPTVQSMNDMDSKGVILNAAFGVSASFVLAGHLAFTTAMDPSFIFPVVVGKLVSGLAGLLLAIFASKLYQEA